MFSSVVIISGFGLGADRALGAGADLARRAQLPVEVVTGVARGKSVDRDAWLRMLDAHGLANHLHVVEADDVAADVFESVRDRDGSLVVMTATARGVLGEHLHGSITATVLHQLRRPVLLLGPNVPQSLQLDTSTLVACTDQSQDIGAALPVIESWQRVFGGHQPWVVQVVPTAGWPAGSIDDAVEHEHVESVAAELRVRGVETTRRVLHGSDPVPSLIELVDHIGDPVFVCVSERWVAGRSHWYWTTRHLVQHAPRPLLVIPADVQLEGLAVDGRSAQ